MKLFCNQEKYTEEIQTKGNMSFLESKIKNELQTWLTCRLYGGKPSSSHFVLFLCPWKNNQKPRAPVRKHSKQRPTRDCPRYFSQFLPQVSTAFPLDIQQPETCIFQKPLPLVSVPLKMVKLDVRLVPCVNGQEFWIMVRVWNTGRHGVSPWPSPPLSIFIKPHRPIGWNFPPPLSLTTIVCFFPPWSHQLETTRTGVASMNLGSGRKGIWFFNQVWLSTAVGCPPENVRSATSWTACK